MRTLILIGLAFLSFSLIADDNKSDRAIEAVRVLCLAGTGYSIEATGDAKLSIFKQGVDGALTFTRKDYKGVVDVPDSEKTTELENIRTCIQPHISRILDEIIGKKDELHECKVAMSCEEEIMTGYRICLDTISELAEENGYSQHWVAKISKERCNSNLRNIRGCYSVSSLGDLKKRQAECRVLTQRDS